MIDITSILTAVIALACALLTAFVIPWIRVNTTVNQQKGLQAVIKIAVTAAEQLYTGTGRGAEKKLYVLKWLEDRGLIYDQATLDAAIEAAVYELKQS